MLLHKYFDPIVGTIEEVKELMGWDRMGTLYTTTQPSYLAPKLETVKGVELIAKFSLRFANTSHRP